jgi:hypothetical protein
MLNAYIDSSIVEHATDVIKYGRYYRALLEYFSRSQMVRTKQPFNRSILSLIPNQGL